MKGVKLDLVGQRFGRLTVLERLGSNGGKYVYWRCKCDCGNIVDVATRGLRSSGTVSCGCNRREKAEKNFGTITLNEKLGRSDGCNFARLRSNKPQKNNTTGYRGVVRTPSGRYYTAVYYKGSSITQKGRLTRRKMRTTRRKNCGKNSLRGTKQKQMSAARIGKRKNNKTSGYAGGLFLLFAAAETNHKIISVQVAIFHAVKGDGAGHQFLI